MGPFDGLTATQRQQIRDAHATRKETDADRAWAESLTPAQRKQIDQAEIRRRIKAARAARKDRGECSTCGREMQLRNNGTVRHHGGDRVPGMPFREYRCPGSGQKPKEG